MAASTVSFYTNEEAYNKTNIQEAFQKQPFLIENIFFFSIKNLGFISISTGNPSSNRTGERLCKQQFSFSIRFECLKIFMFFLVSLKIKKFNFRGGCKNLFFLAFFSH